MPTLLRIDASSRLVESHTRRLADQFVARWLEAHPCGEVVVRDLVQDPVPPIHADTITGFYTPRAEHSETLRRETAVSDQLIGELCSADELLIDTPMYNFTVPSALKAWIDQVVRIGETFSFSSEAGFKGLVDGKTVYVITATGAEFSSPAMQPMDFLTPYLKMLLGFLGMTEVTFLALEGTTTDEARFSHSQQAAAQTIEQLWSTK